MQSPGEEEKPKLENEHRVVWKLAGPAVLLNILQTINGFLDTSFLARIQYQGKPDEAALAGVASASALIFLFFSVGFALGTAPTAIVSRAFGAGDHDEVKLASRKSVGFSLLLGLIAVGLALLVAPVARNWFAPADAPRVGEVMVQYLSVFALSLPALYVIQTIAGAFRAIGDAKSPLYISSVQIALHVIFNVFMIFPTRTWNGISLPGLGWGVTGAAASMATSAWIAAVAYLIFAARSPLEIKRPEWPELPWVKRLLRLAGPACGMAVVRVGSFALLLTILKQVPNAEHALGAMRVGINIEAVAFMPAFGLMISAQALVGQSLGMKDPDRARRLGWLCAHHSAAVVGFVSILLAIFAPQVANAMLEGQSQDVIQTAVMYTYIILATEVLFSYGMVLVGAMQGAGDMVRPFWQTVITLWGVRLPLAACLALPAGWIPGMPGWALGATGVWWAMSVSQTLNGLMAMYQWKQGAWQAARV